MGVTTDNVLVRDNELAAANVDGRVVVLKPDVGSYFDFNRVATEIWDMLAKPCRVEEIFESLSETHDVDTETLVRDVTPFLQALLESRLVRTIDPGELR
ncbi:MAG TPA: PqqD family protein [Pseudolabrys sp.]|nr:PqqD family protein [Pseudolabrys sp.]